jgi:hypothetical protein
MERANVVLEFDLNEYSVLVALLVDGNDFCGDRSHLHHFLRLTSPEMGDALKELQARTVIRGGERVEDTRACRRRCLALSPRRIALVPGSSKPVNRFSGARRFLARPERRSRRPAAGSLPASASATRSPMESISLCWNSQPPGYRTLPS